MSIDRRTLIAGAGAAATGAVLPSIAADAADAVAARPNVLWIVTDDQPRQTLDYMPQTVAQLCDPGVRFPNGYSAVPLCGPARATLLSGLYPHNHGIRDNSTAEPFRIRHEKDTVATRMQAAGYTTALFGKYLNGYNQQSTHRPPGWNRWVVSVENGSTTWNVDGTMQTIKGRQDPYAVTRFLEFTRAQASTGAPWFAFLSLSNPHEGYSPTPGNAGAFNGAQWRPTALNEADLSDKPSFMQQNPNQSLATIDLHWEGKLEELQDTDDQIAAVIAALEQAGQLAGTIIFFISDNGYMLGEHRLLKKEHPYEESAAIPFAVRGPGVAPRSSPSLVSQVDLMPTTLAVAGLDPNAGRALDGRTMLPVLAGEPGARWRQRLLIEHPLWGWSMLRQGNTVYIHRHGKSGQPEEMYDLLADPVQMRSVHATTDTAPWRARLTAMRQATGAQLRALEELTS